MKNILITGANSYIGTSVEKWLLKEPDKYHIETLDMKDENWRSFDFSKFDVVFHVAGIAHIKETKKNKDLYYKVNRDLAIKTAQKAKQGGVNQFIFLSSMSVYGIERGVITRDTVPKPKTAYGKSKYEAENEIALLQDENFKVLILRPPMIYGPGSPGNYQRLYRLALKLPFYPNISNKRSMLYIDNLSIHIDYYIKNIFFGIHLPQNNEYVSTTRLINEIRILNNKREMSTTFFNFLVKISIFIFPLFKKIFGDLYYEQEMININMIGFRESILKSEVSL